MFFQNEDTVTMGFVLTRNARHFPNKMAIVFDKQRFTYKKFNEAVNKTANALLDLGIQKGERVAMMLPNSIPMVELYWATAKIGAVIVPLNPMVKGKDCAYIINDSKPKVIVVDHKHFDDIENIRDMLNSVEVFVKVGEGDSEGYLNYYAIKNKAKSNEPDCYVTKDDDCNIMYTSGTTGLPKGIVHTHEMRVQHTLAYTVEFSFNSESISFSAGSLVFNGMLCFMYPVIMTGGTFVFMPKYNTEEAIKLIEREQITHTMFVPTQIISLLDSPQFNPILLASLEVILSLGAPLGVNRKKELCEKLPGRLHELYGLTEGFATIMKNKDILNKPKSVGVPAIFHEYKIMNEEMEEVEIGEIGEIIGRGPSLMKGYYNNEEETNKAIYKNKWIKTGDLGYQDEDGFLYLVDRKNDTIITGGINVYPSDIEKVITEHASVAECVVFGTPHEKWGETPVAHVTLKPGETIDQSELLTWINERVPGKYQRINDLQIVDDFPRNTSGKILRRTLRGKYKKVY